MIPGRARSELRKLSTAPGALDPDAVVAAAIVEPEPMNEDSAFAHWEYDLPHETLRFQGRVGGNSLFENRETVHRRQPLVRQSSTCGDCLRPSQGLRNFPKVPSKSGASHEWKLLVSTSAQGLISASSRGIPAHSKMSVVNRVRSVGSTRTWFVMFVSSLMMAQVTTT